MLPDPSGKATRSDDELKPGFEFQPWTFSVDADYRAQKLTCSGIDPAIWGEFLDPSHFALLTIRQVNRDGFSINGSVHMIQHYRQHEPVRVGEEITLRGRVTGIEPAPRGTLFHASFEVVRPDGSVPLELSRTSVRMDHEGGSKGPGSSGGGARENPDEGFLTLPRIGEKQLTPEGVGNYSDDKMNRIHDDPEIARQFGFRAPIAAGIMGSHIMMEALVLDGGGPPKTLDMEVRFRRPMFWDELLTVTGEHAPANRGGHLSKISLMKPEGKPACFSIVRQVTY